MSGFVVESRISNASGNLPLRLVDLGHCEMVAARSLGRTRIAWARWTESRHLRVWESPRRFLFVEGQPDRLPGDNEPLEKWLNGRGGSFRGFEIEFRAGLPERITVFVDPMGTRPIFLLTQPGRICFADKLASIVANTPGLECDWGALIECAVVGSTISAPTSVRHVVMLAPGEVVQIDETAVSRRRSSPAVLDTGVRPSHDASKRLEHALRTAISKTWTDPDACLLLSGGLDSRLLLGLSSLPAPKTATLDIYPEETPIARQVAKARGADFRVLPCSLEHCCLVMQKGYLLTGAMHQSIVGWPLGLGYEWRKLGIPAVVHGYFHNTIFRGWAAERWQKYPDLDFSLAQYMGPKAHYFDGFPNSRKLLDGVIDLLSEDGRELLRRQLTSLADQLEMILIDGFDLTRERLMMREVGRQLNFATFAAWLEEIDVVSPVFHPAPWNWYATTHPADRHRDLAVRQAYQTMAYGLRDIPDLSTGPVRVLPKDWRETMRNQVWFPAARKIKRKLARYRKPRPPKRTHTPTDFDKIYRQPAIVEALCLGVEALRGNPVFDRSALDNALAAYLAGDNGPGNSLWTVASAGQWQQFLKACGAGDPAIREAFFGSQATAASLDSTSNSCEDSTLLCLQR